MVRPAATSAALISVLAAALAGCSAPPDPDSPERLAEAITSGDPAARSAWIVRTSADPDQGDVRVLLAGLASDDAAERMLAITALDRIYGERLGYDYTDPPAARRVAVDRWRKKLSPSQQPANTSADNPSGTPSSSDPSPPPATPASAPTGAPQTPRPR